jgi:sarcosine oxidase subunit beta
MGTPRAELPDVVDVAIVGGGIMGLALAYNLALLNKRRKVEQKIAVIEGSYLVSGASGRNGGGIRMQWGDPGNVELMQRSIRICESLAQELGINLWFRQGGYLFLARSESGETRLLRNAEVHRDAGAPTRLLSPEEARTIVPELSVDEVRLASFNPKDGVVFPWPFLWGYAAKAVELGVCIRTHTKVELLEPLDDGYSVRMESGERIEARQVVNATGAWSIELNGALGIELPNHPHRHEILSSEPLKPFLNPLVVDLSTGLYFSQSTRGEIVTGITMPDPPGVPAKREINLGSSLRFLTLISRTLTDLMPITRGLHPLRQWAGPYDISPDGDAIVGPSPGHPRLIQLCGFTGHGFMMAPAVGELLAKWLATEEKHPMLERWDPLRFSRGDYVRKEDMIIG